jgi:hypothetical protein
MSHPRGGFSPPGHRGGVPAGLGRDRLANIDVLKVRGVPVSTGVPRFFGERYMREKGLVKTYFKDRGFQNSRRRA